MKRAAIIISPNYEDHARKYWKDCLESLRRQDWPGEKKIFITDNQSTEESYSFLKETSPEAAILRNIENRGFAGGNNDAMRIALAEGYDYLILFNMDTVVETGCVRHLVEAAQTDSAIGAVQARLMLWPQTNKINSLGNVTHFLGFGYCDGYGEDWFDQTPCAMRDIAYASGAAVLYKREVLERVGIFDEEFRMYNEDQDLGWRIWLARWRCVLAPRAVAYHKYDFSRYPGRYYWLDRNRMLAMIKNYESSTLALIAPAFLVMELGLLLFAFQRGWLGDKLKVYGYFLNRQNRQYLMNARRETQSLRRVKDKEIIGNFSGGIWYDEVGDWKLHWINRVMSAYWRAIKSILNVRNGAVA